MKGTSLIVSIVLFILIAGLYILHFTGGGSKPSGTNFSAGSSDGKSVRIAYVKADSIILNYKLSEVLHDDFTKKQEAYAGEYANKRRSFEKDAVAFQEKLQRGGFLSEERAVQERNRLAGVEQDILRMDQELSGKLGEIQAANSQQVLDSLLNTIKRYNAEKGYDYILNAASILDGNEGDNVTAEVLKMMNDKYIAPAAK
ncbi:MAG: OmpH family outer membrane protein [Draconibacterium sp.]